MKREAYALYQDLRPLLVGLEHERRRLLRRLTTAGICLGSVTAIGALKLFSTGFDLAKLQLLAYAIVAVSFILFSFYKLSWTGYKRSFKQTIIKSIMGLFGSSVNYYPEGSLSDLDFDTSGLFNARAKRFNGEDLIEGVIEGQAFKASEVHAEGERGSSKNRKEHYTIFKGLLFITLSPKMFKSNTYLLADTFGARSGGVMQQVQKVAGYVQHRGELVKLEDPSFERYFAVFSQDQIEARYLLTPKMMEHLTAFRQKHKARVYVSFVDKHVYVAIESAKDLFEPPLLKTLLDLQLYRDYIDDIELVTDILKDLNLVPRAPVNA